MTPATPPPNLSPADEQRLQEWLDWYATRQPEPMPVDELPALLRDVAEGRVSRGIHSQMVEERYSKMDLTPEQSRQIDAAVAKAMGLNVVATEWLCLNWNGRLEAYKTPDHNEPPYFNYVRGRPSQIETIRPVYLPKDGERWPPFQVRPVGEDEDIWFADVEVVPEYSTKHEVWATVERFMVENFKGAKQARYAKHVTKIPQAHYTSVYNIGVIGFVVATAPLPVRCCAFLRAMGVDIDALLVG